MGKPSFYGSIRLDNQGLRGGKKIEIPQFNNPSENFTFFKDQLKVKEPTLLLNQVMGRSLFPKMEISNFDVRWLTLRIAFI